MSTTGEVFPTSGASVSEAPWSNNTWSTPGNVTANDAAYASVTAGTFDTADHTFVLKASGFDFSTIPDGSTIDGVTARVEARGNSALIFIDLAQLLDVSGAKVGTNLAAATANDIPLTTSDTVYTLGGASNLWGNALDVGWVKDPDFGIALGGRTDQLNGQIFIDYVTLEITYTPPVTVPSGAAAAGLALAVTTAGSRLSAAAAGLGTDLAVATGGSRMSAGTAASGAALALAATGSRQSAGTAGPSMDLAVGVVGSAPVVGGGSGTAQVGVDLEVAADGSRRSVAVAHLGAALDLAITGSAPAAGVANGAAALDVGFGVATAGSAPARGAVSVGIDYAVLLQLVAVPTDMPSWLASSASTAGLASSAPTAGLAASATPSRLLAGVKS